MAKNFIDTCVIRFDMLVELLKGFLFSTYNTRSLRKCLYYFNCLIAGHRVNPVNTLVCAISGSFWDLTLRQSAFFETIIPILIY